MPLIEIVTASEGKGIVVACETCTPPDSPNIKILYSADEENSITTAVARNRGAIHIGLSSDHMVVIFRYEKPN